MGSVDKGLTPLSAIAEALGTDESAHTALDDGDIDFFDATGTWVTSG